MAEPGASVTRLAKKAGRMYITAEDIKEALKSVRVERVRRDVLAVLGEQTTYGTEDAGLCAFVAWKGTAE